MSIKLADWSWTSNGNDAGDDFIQWAISNNTDSEITTLDEEYILFFNGDAKETRSLISTLKPGNTTSTMPYQWDPPTLGPGDEFWLEHEDGTELLYRKIPDSAELGVDSLDIIPDLADVGENIDAEITVTNYGNLEGSSSFDIYRTLNISGSNQQDPVTTLDETVGPDETVSIPFTVEMPDPIYLPDGETLTVYEGGDYYPSDSVNLRVAEMYMVDGSQFSSDSIKENSVAEVGFTVGNDGNADGRAVVEVDIGSASFEHTAYVESGNERDFVLTLNPNSLDPGDYDVTVDMVDPDGATLDAGTITIEEDTSIEEGFYINIVDIQADNPSPGEEVDVQLHIKNEVDQDLEADARVSVNGDLVKDEFVSVSADYAASPKVTVQVPNAETFECCAELKNRR
jgi:hypothetical protein